MNLRYVFWQPGRLDASARVYGSNNGTVQDAIVLAELWDSTWIGGDAGRSEVRIGVPQRMEKAAHKPPVMSGKVECRLCIPCGSYLASYLIA